MTEEERMEAFRKRMQEQYAREGRVQPASTNAVAAAMDRGRMPNAELNLAEDQGPESGVIVTSVARGGGDGVDRAFTAFGTKSIAPMVERARLNQQPQGATVQQAMGQPAAAAQLRPALPAQEQPVSADAVRQAMGGGAQPAAGMAPAPLPGAAPAGQPAPAAGPAFDPMRDISPRDRLTLAMWGNSPDTKGMSRYNEVAKRLGLPMKELPKTMLDKRIAATGGAYTATSQGGSLNRITGELNNPAPAPEKLQQIDWNKRIVKNADGTNTDMETGITFGPKAQQEHNWVVMPNGQRLDTKSPSGDVTGDPAELEGAGRYLSLGNDVIYDMKDKRYVRPDGASDTRKDEYQGQVVKIATGKDSYMVGVYDRAKSVYAWKPNVKNGSVFTNPDGSSWTSGGEGGLDLANVKDWVDPAKTKPAAAPAAPAAPAQTGAQNAPAGFIGTMPNGRRRQKQQDGSWKEEQPDGTWVPVK